MFTIILLWHNFPFIPTLLCVLIPCNKKDFTWTILPFLHTFLWRCQSTLYIKRDLIFDMANGRNEASSICKVRAGEVLWLPKATACQDLNWKPDLHGVYSYVPLSPLSTDHVCTYAAPAFKYLILNLGSVLFSTWSYGEKNCSRKKWRCSCFAETAWRGQTWVCKC